MHFINRNNNSGSSDNLITATSHSTPRTSRSVRLGLWCFLLVAVILLVQQQPCEGRYLETRSNGDALDKLRELMVQILESSDEEPTDAQRKLASWKFDPRRGAYDNGHRY